MPVAKSLPPCAVEEIKEYLLNLQNTLCASLEALDSQQSFVQDVWQRSSGGGGITRVLSQGKVFEKAGVNFSHVFGKELPPTATLQRPHLAGHEFTALGLSVVIHPNNPYVPTAHANVRFFMAQQEDGAPVWWFGGGYDLTPYYGFVEDCVHWHQTAQKACQPFGDSIYPTFKAWCDRYFFINHRNEPRGIGGLFFDDYNEQGFEHSFALMRSIGSHFIKAYEPIVQRRYNHPFGAREKKFQHYRRGRYVEFNLIYDRGTLFGLQSGGRTESILMSLPPVVHWDYGWSPEQGSDEADLYSKFLTPRDWINYKD